MINFCKDKRSFQDLTVAGETINLVELEKILGLVVQNKLKWNLPVDQSIVKKSSKYILFTGWEVRTGKIFCRGLKNGKIFFSTDQPKR